MAQADGHGFRPLGQIRISMLDVKLGIRMLAKYRGLSAIAVIGMAVAIAIGAGAFGYFAAVFDTWLPLDEGDRVVAINLFDARQGRNRQFASDFRALA